MFDQRHDLGASLSLTQIINKTSCIEAGMGYTRVGGITVDEETVGLLDYAATCCAESGGLFDITSGILRRAWRFAQGDLPDPDHITALHAHIGWHRLSWQTPNLYFLEPGLELDFGGVVKEYAANQAVRRRHAVARRH